MKKKTLISIIIATYNSQATLEESIKSIIDQEHDNCEILIIDGKSTDGTVDIIKKYEAYIEYWSSEPDFGIYDAWNKGLSVSKGDWICFLGSDDQFLSGALSTYSKYLEANSDLDYVSSRVELFWESKGKYKSRIIGDKLDWNIFKRRMNVAHVGSMHNRRLYTNYANYDTSYRIASDYEFLLRIGRQLKPGYIDNVTVKMRFGGASTKNIFLTIRETRDIKLKFNYTNKISIYIDYLYSVSRSSLKQILTYLRIL